jgi:hypothetical protein
MISAEGKCRKLKTGMVKWSPMYQKACDRVEYWHLLYKEATGRRFNARKILSLRKKLKMKHHCLTTQEIETHWSTAIQQRKKCKPYASELQLEYRHCLAHAKEQEDNIPAALHIKNLTRQKNTRALFRRIRYLERKVQNLATSRLTVTTTTGMTKELTQKEAIEDHIIWSNEKKYHQTEGHGQLQKGQLLHDTGIMGTGPKANQILQGVYTPPVGTSEVTKSFLHVLKQPTNCKTVPLPSYSEFCQGWQKAKETTGSNGPHFGHYKVATIYHPHIGKLLYRQSQIPMLTGYSPRRHREGIDVMLLKKEQNYHVDKLRTIVLFDSEANMLNNKHTGRRSMDAAIKLNEIVTEQYSRPNRKAIDHALNRRLVMDHQLYLRQPYSFASCDLKSCYDRINHTSASLSLQKIGIRKVKLWQCYRPYSTCHIESALPLEYLPNPMDQHRIQDGPCLHRESFKAMVVDLQYGQF